MDEFQSWARHPITLAVFGELAARVAQLTEELIEQTVNGNAVEMAHKTGAIKALRDVLDIKVEETDAD